MKKIILLFGFDDLQSAQQAYALQEFTRAQDVTVRRVQQEDYRRTMLSLVQDAAAENGAAGSGSPSDAGRHGRTPSAAASQNKKRKLPARMLLFAAFTDQELYSVLDLCPACGITKNDLKAAMTPANSRWDAFRLCDNILEEHRKLQ